MLNKDNKDIKTNRYNDCPDYLACLFFNISISRPLWARAIFAAIFAASKSLFIECEASMWSLKLHPPYIVTSRDGRIITVACETISHAGVVLYWLWWWCWCPGSSTQLVAAVPGVVLSNQLGDLPVSRSVVLTGCNSVLCIGHTWNTTSTPVYVY